MAPEIGTSTEFELDRSITLAGSAASVSLSGDTDAAVLLDIEQNNSFPDGAVSLGRIAFGAKTNQNITFKAGEAKVTFGAAVTARLEAGIFTSSAPAIASLQLPETPNLDLMLPASATERFFVLVTGYAASGHLEATHPIGVLGSATFGVEAAHASTFAVIHRFDADESTSARTVIADTISSWRLPRHVDVDAGGTLNLKPGTWLVAETDGSLAVKLAAQLGYDVTFIREAKLLGLTRNLGVKIDAALKATFGFSVAGRYVLVVGREDSKLAPGQTVRLRLYKTTKKGLDIALNADVGVTASLPLPSDLNDLVQAVFGQHGLQVLKDIEQWADPNTPIANNVAKLANDKGLELLRRVAGIDLETEFDKGRAAVLAALKQWDALPDNVSAFLWKHLGASQEVADQLKAFLQALADPDAETRAEALAKAITQDLFADSPIAQFLQAAAERGLLALPLADASRIAAQTLDILNGGLIKKLHDFIEEKLNLDVIRKGDFAKIDSWLVARLADFLNKTALGAPEFQEIQAAITALDAKVRDIYTKGIQAATKRYNATFAATYRRATTDTALLDVTFDLGQLAARTAFLDVANGHLDDLLTQATAGVAIGKAVLSHEIDRRSTVSLHLPFGDFDTTHVNNAIASLTVEEHAGRILVYDVKGEDQITKARYLSDLSLLARVRFENGRAIIDDSGTLAYESLQTQRAMRVEDLNTRTEPFIQRYFPNMFGGGDAALPTFLLDLDAMIGGSSNRLGDVALSMQVSYPTRILGGWLRDRRDTELRADAGAISRRIQKTWRPLLASAYCQDLDHLDDNEVTAALLVWSCLPVSTWVDFEDGTITGFDSDHDPYWDWPSRELRRAMARHGLTVAGLAKALNDAHTRLAEAGHANADSFGAERTGRFIDMALNDDGDVRLQSLLFTEAEIVHGAQDALKAISRASQDLATAPTRAVTELADFASALTDTFNNRVSSVYGTTALRALGPMILSEASAALTPGLAIGDATAMLRMYFFTDTHAFPLDQFTKNELPPKADVRLAQTLVTP